MKGIFFVLLLVASCLLLHAQQQGLDPTFGNGGVVLRVTSPDNGGFGGVALLSDGKIIAGSDSLARYNNNGALDLNFGHNGRVQYFYGTDIFLQPDGKILAAGGYPFYPMGGGVCRLLADGAPDITFGSNCLVSADSMYVEDSFVQPDGKIVVLGNYLYNTVALLRFLPDGMPDSSFGVNGKVFQYFPYPNGIELKGGGLMVDGRIVIGGHSTAPDSFFAMRFTSDGKVDTSLNHSGKTSVANLWPCAAVAVQEDGKILLAGHTIFGDAVPFMLLRFNVDGSVDNDFGNNGLATYQWESGEENKVRVMKIQSDGKIILAGRVGSDNEHKYNFALVRFLSNGQLDNSFGSNGALQTRIRNDWDEIKDIALQPDGKIIAVGVTEKENCNNCNDEVMVRYMPDGKTDVPDIRSLLNGITLYPNPTSGRLFIAYPVNSEINSVKLYDVAGRLLRQWSGKAIELDLKERVNGAYMLRIEEKNGEAISKPFFVLH